MTEPYCTPNITWGLASPEVFLHLQSFIRFHYTTYPCIICSFIDLSMEFHDHCSHNFVLFVNMLGSLM